MNGKDRKVPIKRKKAMQNGKSGAEREEEKKASRRHSDQTSPR